MYLAFFCIALALARACLPAGTAAWGLKYAFAGISGFETGREVAGWADGPDGGGGVGGRSRMDGTKGEEDDEMICASIIIFTSSWGLMSSPSGLVISILGIGRSETNTFFETLVLTSFCVSESMPSRSCKLSSASKRETSMGNTNSER